MSKRYCFGKFEGVGNLKFMRQELQVLVLPPEGDLPAKLSLELKNIYRDGFEQVISFRTSKVGCGKAIMGCLYSAVTTLREFQEKDNVRVGNERLIIEGGE